MKDVAASEEPLVIASSYSGMIRSLNLNFDDEIASREWITRSRQTEIMEDLLPSVWCVLRALYLKDPTAYGSDFLAPPNNRLGKRDCNRGT